MPPMISLLLTVLAAGAHAKPLGWLQHTADSVVVPAATDLPLLRGASTDYLPAVAGEVPVEGQQAPRPTLVRIELTSGWSRVDPETLSTLGGTWEWTQLRGEWHRIAELPALRLGEVELLGVHLEVDEQADGLVLSFASLPEVGVAVLPSKGIVRVVPARDAGELVRSVGGAVKLSAQPTKPWDHDGQSVAGDGTTLRVPSEWSFGEVSATGVVHLSLQTASSRTTTRSTPRPALRGGQPAFEVEGTLGEAELWPTWAPVDASLSDPHPDFLGQLGYDALYRVDLALSAADRTLSARAIAAPIAHDADALAVAFARTRFEQDEALRPTEARTEGRVQIGFDGPQRAAIPLGDPGDPVLRDRHLDLAETLWRAGELDESLKHYLAASEHAGDHCLTHLRLGQRRLAWSGARQTQSFVQDLTEQPLRRAGTLWSQWIELDQPTRDAIWAGTELPEGSIQVYQPPECMEAWGLLAAAATAQGRREVALDLETRLQDRSLSVAFARANRLLEEQQHLTAEGVLSFVVDHREAFPLDQRIALAQAMAGRQAGEAMRERIREVPTYPTDHPLTAALGVLEAGRIAGDAKGATRALVQGDEAWMWGQVAHAVATGEAPPPWNDAPSLRWPGSPQVEALRAVHLAVSGELEEGQAHLDAHKARGVADYWAARAVLAWLSGDEEGRLGALRQWSLRFPLLPGSTLGTLPVE